MPGERIILKTREKIRGLEEGNWVKEEEKGEETLKELPRVYSVGSHHLARSTKGKSPFSPPPSPPPPSSLSPPFLSLSVLRRVQGTEGAPPAGRFGRGKVNAPRRTVSRCEAEQCRRRRRRRRRHRYHRRRHLEQIMARIRRGGERTAGRTGFSWVGLGWVGITSAIDLITPCGPRCLLVSVPLSLSVSPLVLTLYRFPSPSPQPSCPSRVRRHPRILSLSLSHCPLYHACPLRVSPLASSPATSSTCVSAASSRASCLHFALTFSPPRLLLSRCSALPPLFSPPPPPPPPLRVTSPRCTAPRNVFFFSSCAPIHRSPFLFIKRDAYALRYGRVHVDVNFPENYFAEGGKLGASRVSTTHSHGEAKITMRKRTSHEIAAEGP